jgi:hypothetical protein
MKSMSRLSFSSLLLGFLAAFGSGCAGVSMDRLRLRQYAQEFQYTHEVQAAMAAARASLEDMGFTRDRGSESDGRLEMVSRPLPGNGAQNKLQRRAIVAVGWTPEGMSEVRIGFWDETEDPSGSESVPNSGRLIKEGALYDAFWQRMDTALPPSSSLLPAQDESRPATGG